MKGKIDRGERTRGLMGAQLGQAQANGSSEGSSLTFAIGNVCMLWASIQLLLGCTLSLYTLAHIAMHPGELHGWGLRGWTRVSTEGGAGSEDKLDGVYAFSLVMCSFSGTGSTEAHLGGCHAG